MNNLDLYHFIGLCLVMDDDPAVAGQVRATLEADKVSWKHFVWMGSSHFVLPALYSAFRRNGMLKLLPADLEEHMENIYEINLYRNQRILEQVREITLLLSPHGIEPVFLKGTGHLLRGLYHDSGDRIMADIDFLIPEEKVVTAVNILMKEGYQHNPYYLDMKEEEHHHYHGIFKEGTPSTVEIHRTPSGEEFNQILPARQVLSGKLPVPGLPAYVMAPADALKLHIIHDYLIGSNPNLKSCSLKSLYDFYLLSKQVSLAEIYMESGKYRLKFGAYGLIASRTLGIPHLKDGTITKNAVRIYKRHQFFLARPELAWKLQKLNGFYKTLLTYLTLMVKAPFFRHERGYVIRRLRDKDWIRGYMERVFGVRFKK
jgi:hypothetical protein